MSCGVSCRQASDLVSLWLWRRAAAVALIPPTALELPYATGATWKEKAKTNKQKNPKKTSNNNKTKDSWRSKAKSQKEMFKLLTCQMTTGPNEIISPLWEVWGSVHLSAPLFPLTHTHTDTHRHTHTHSISFSFYTPIMNGRLTSIIAFGDSLHFLGQVEYRGFRDNSAKNSHQNVQVFRLFYKWRNWSLWSLSFLKSHGEYFKPNSTYSSLFFLTMLYCLSMDRAGEHIGIKSVHSWQIVEKEG